MAESAFFLLADRYVTDWAALDPCAAWCGAGITDHATVLTDYSPDGCAARTELARSTVRELGTIDRSSDCDHVGAEMLASRLAAEIELFEADEWVRSLSVIFGPHVVIRQVFDLMATDTVAAWESVNARMANVEAALAGARASLQHGLDQGRVAARRQALAAAAACAVWGGDHGTGFFTGLSASAPEAIRDRVMLTAQHADQSFADHGKFLRTSYAPRSNLTDGFGRERYELWATAMLGAHLDLDETYAWGWDELHRIEDDMRATARQIVPGASIAEAVTTLEADPKRIIHGEENLREWLQALMDRTVADMNGKHFDIAEPIQRVEAMIAPPGGAAAMYYTPPSDDLSRPGRTWYPTMGKTQFPTWGEVSICYHEGVPGHHLQMATAAMEHQSVDRFRRVTEVPGHAEGWALYAERLMDELGYLEDPGFRLGYLRAQVMRAVRVVVDIGMHLGLRIPRADGFHPGERWTPELGQEFATARAWFPPDFMASEIDRYLGVPAQAISYKVGERVWLQARADARERSGPAFNLKEFHMGALRLGNLGLDLLQRELARL